MTMFSNTASPGQRWKMFLPGAVSMQSGVLSMSTASALIRNRVVERRRTPVTTADDRRIAAAEYLGVGA